MPEALLSGLLMGLIYALVALGLALIWGITDVFNFAHGELLMLSMYAAYWLYTLGHVDPTLASPLVAVVLAGIGFAVFALVIRPLQRGPAIAVIVATFGLGIVLRQLAFVAFSPDYRSLPDTWLSGSLALGVINVGRPQVVTAAMALALAGLLFWLVYRTRSGRALQAVAEDREAAALVGIAPNRVGAQVWMIGAAAVGVAGALLTTFFYVFPSVGTVFGLLAFVAVALGGFGSLAGTFVAGIAIGVIESLAGYLVAPSLKTVFIFLIFLLVLWFRPRGIFGRW